MLYWHFGQKRTATTSLQAALVAHREQLARAGVVYPEDWMGDDLSGYFTHHGISEVLASSNEDALPVRRFREYLEGRGAGSVVISSELVSDWLSGTRYEAVLRVLSLARSVMPVTGIWTLRRLDDRTASQCLRWALLGADLVFPEAEHVSPLVDSFAAMAAGMREVEKKLEQKVSYLEYDRDGAHNEGIVRILKLPPALERSIVDSLTRGPRLNPQMSHKAAIAMRFADAIAERTGAQVSRSALKRAFFLGDFRFEDDGPCEVLGAGVRRQLHEGALEVARSTGLEDYVEFFADNEIKESEPSAIDLSLLSEEDLARLVDYLGELQGADLYAVIERRIGSASGPHGGLA